MPLFTYRALNAAGRPERGTLSAATEHEALAVLRGRAVYPLALRASRPFALRLPRLFGLGRGARLSSRELAMFCRQLATLLEATIPYDAALRMVQTETSSTALQAAPMIGA